MRTAATALFVSFLVASSAAHKAISNEKAVGEINDVAESELATGEEDEQFWERFLNNFDVSKYQQTNPWYIKKHKMSLNEPSASPSESPTRRPTEPPTKTPSSRPSRSPSSPPSNLPCNVSVTVICEDQDEVPCDEIPPPEAMCFSTGNNVIEVLSFTYLPGNTCEMSRNQQYNTSTCQDLGPLDDVPVTLVCVDNNGNAMVVNEQNITVDGEILFTVLPPGGSGFFPPSITCTIRNANTGQALQRNTIDTSGNSELGLKEAYGAMQLESCDDQVCIQEVFFRNVIENLGGDFMEVNLVNITIGGREPQDLTYLVRPNPLPPGDRFTLVDVVYLDYCETGNISYCVDVEANPPFGEECDAEDKVIFPIEPECEVMLNLTCVEINSGLPCDEIPPIENPQCVCPECSNMLMFRYTGESCGNDGDGVTCVQTGSMSPLGGTLQVSRDASFSDNIFFRTVTPGIDIRILDGSRCIPDTLYIRIIAEGTQTITLDTACTTGNGLDLGKAVGALDFVGFSCDDGSAKDCFSDVLLTTCPINQGTIPLFLTNFSVGIVGQPMTDLLGDQDIVLLPGEAYCAEEIAEIYKCNETVYTVVSNVEANDTSAKGCKQTNQTQFEITTNTPPPSVSPSREPSAEPSPSPTKPPTRNPSSSPSAPPTAATPPPTRSPSASPSAPPTAATPPPTRSPSASPSAPPTAATPPPTRSPSASPSAPPTAATPPPTRSPSASPSAPPTAATPPPTRSPSASPSAPPTAATPPPTRSPSASPSAPPTAATPPPTRSPSASPSAPPTAATPPPTPSPSASPSAPPTGATPPPTPSPSASPSAPPTGATPPPTPSPSASPSAPPTAATPPPTPSPSASPSAPPTGATPPPTPSPSASPSAPPTGATPPPTFFPSDSPSAPPTGATPPPTPSPSASPSAPPTAATPPPTPSPSASPSAPPTAATPPPTPSPSNSPSAPPTAAIPPPTPSPSAPPSAVPSGRPIGECTVSVEIVCDVVGNEGLECADLGPPPTARCSNGERLDSVTFSYVGQNDATCEDSRNQQGEEARCVDVNQLVSGPVNIECFDLIMTPLIVDNPTVQPGGIFSVTSDVPGTPLVQKINCTISQVGIIRQWDVIDVSGNVELDLQEQYGALVLESCDGLTCIQEVDLSTFINNIGLNPMNISLGEETIEGLTTNILGNLTPVGDGALEPLYVLQPGERAFFERNDVIIDLCDAADFNYRIDVQAQPPGGLECNDTETIAINIAPQCIVDTTFVCTFLETGQDCSEIPRLESPDCDCGETCPTEMLFRYSPTTCDESPSDSSFAVVNCEQLLDMPANPTITVTSDGTQYFNGPVNPDLNIVLSAGGACLSETFTVLVQNSAGDAVQRFTLEPGCTNGNSRSLGLTSSYVSFDFYGFTCQESLPINCFADIELEQCAVNNGLVDLTLTEFEQTFEGTTVNLLNDGSVTSVLEPGTETCANPRQYEIYLCDAATYTGSGSVEADDTSGTSCSGTTPLSFDIQPPETFPPTFFPTEFPSPVPSQPPSVVPSIAPTESCALEVNLSCVGCTVNNSDLPLCEERPTLIGMLFRGGNCSQNNFSQPLTKVTCVDFNQQAPPLGSNVTVYVRANADPKDGLPGGTGGDSETLLFEGLVTEGSVFYMYDGGNRLPADTQLRMWPATGPRDSSTILQDVRFHASCSQPFLLNNVFGSYQFVMFQNELQGNVTLFLSQTSDFDISIPINGLPTGDTILTIFNATIRTNYTDPPVSILTPLIGQKLCSPEVAADPTNDCTTSTVEVEFDTTLNLAQPQGYLQEITILAIGDETGQRCIGRGVLEFFAPLSSDFGEIVDD
ncbi:hypothetical protein ACA910_004579 [Epithemia clementina (nom. ined.)]